MTGRPRSIFPDPEDYDYGCDYNAYDAPNTSMMNQAKSSSGTSVSSCAQPTQRYPQTTSARRKCLTDQKPPSPRGYMAAEPCLSTPTPGATAGQIASKFCSKPQSYRPTRSNGYSERPSSPRSASPGCSTSQSSRRQQEKPSDDYCEAEMNQCKLFHGKAATAKKQVAFDCTPPAQAEPPRTPRSAAASMRSYNKPAVPVSELFDPEDQNTLFGICPNLAPEDSTHCSFQEYNEDRDEGFLAKLMKKIKGPTNPCPLKVDFSSRKQRNYSALMRKRSSCFSKRESKDQSLEQLDDLWNPDTFMRWKCIDNWDQHKESLWRSVIQAKLDCPESHNRCIEDMMFDAFKAMNAPGGECISFRMIYGILRRNEDMYLNPYIDHFTDEQFLKLIVALNRFYMEDKDKRKMFFDHPPPTFIEKIMMKETLGVLDPTCPSQTIARRFWELLLDWYARKINEPEEETTC